MLCCAADAAGCSIQQQSWQLQAPAFPAPLLQLQATPRRLTWTPMRCSLRCRVTKERAAVASRPCTRLQMEAREGRWEGSKRRAVVSQREAPRDHCPGVHGGATHPTGEQPQQPVRSCLKSSRRKRGEDASAAAALASCCAPPEAAAAQASRAGGVVGRAEWFKAGQGRVDRASALGSQPQQPGSSLLDQAQPQTQRSPTASIWLYVRQSVALLGSRRSCAACSSTSPVSAAAWAAAASKGSRCGWLSRVLLAMATTRSTTLTELHAGVRVFGIQQRSEQAEKGSREAGGCGVVPVRSSPATTAIPGHTP